MNNQEQEAAVLFIKSDMERMKKEINGRVYEVFNRYQKALSRKYGGEQNDLQMNLYTDEWCIMGNNLVFDIEEDGLDHIEFPLRIPLSFLYDVESLKAFEKECEEFNTYT